jgi:hypothetical protein
MTKSFKRSEKEVLYDDQVGMHDKEFLAHFYYKRGLMSIKPQNQDGQADDAKAWMEWRQCARCAMMVVAANREGRGIRYYCT